MTANRGDWRATVNNSAESTDYFLWLEVGENVIEHDALSDERWQRQCAQLLRQWTAENGPYCADTEVTECSWT